MKTIFKLLLISMVLTIIACRDSKKEEMETKAAVEQIETMESEAEKVSETIDKDAKDLEDELNELDNL